MDCYQRHREVEKPKKQTAGQRRKLLRNSVENTMAMLDRRADAIALTLGEENPLRMDLLATKHLLLQLGSELWTWTS